MTKVASVSWLPLLILWYTWLAGIAHLIYLSPYFCRFILLPYFCPMIRYLMRVQCVTSFGLIQMIVVDGEFLLVGLDTPLDRISLNSSITLMALLSFLELTSLLWKDTIGPRFVDSKWLVFTYPWSSKILSLLLSTSNICRTRMWWQCSVRQITAIAVGIWLQYLR